MKTHAPAAEQTRKNFALGAEPSPIIAESESALKSVRQDAAAPQSVQNIAAHSPYGAQFHSIQAAISASPQTRQLQALQALTNNSAIVQAQKRVANLASAKPAQRREGDISRQSRFENEPAQREIATENSMEAAVSQDLRSTNTASTYKPERRLDASNSDSRAPGTAQLKGAASASGIAVVQRAPDDIFNFISNNADELGEVTGAELKRLLYWDDMGRFVPENGKPRLTVGKINKARALKTPLEKAAVDEGALPEWMRIREPFGVRLPDFFGGGKLTFPKRPENVVFEGRGWIADNVYWRAPAHPRVKYMIHAIVEWAGERHRDPPTPHITLRNAVTQAEIDLDMTNPLPDDAKRVIGLAATRASYSQGLGVNREPGMNMVRDDATFANLTSGAVQAWLGTLRDKAQAAIIT